MTGDLARVLVLSLGGESRRVPKDTR
jgi:hypothetical protein